MAHMRRFLENRPQMNAMKTLQSQLIEKVLFDLKKMTRNFH